jgi:hypothetical protein
MSDHDYSLKLKGEKDTLKWKVEFKKQSTLYDIIWLKGIFSQIDSDFNTYTDMMPIYWCFTIKAFEKRKKEEKLLNADFNKIADKLMTLVQQIIVKDGRNHIASVWIKSNIGGVQIHGDFNPNVIDTCDKLE